MNNLPAIAVIGAGNVGGGLGTTLSRAGYPVTFGVRPGRDIAELLTGCGDQASSTDPAAAAAAADVVFLAVPASSAIEAATSLGDLTGKVVVDCNNPLRWENGPVWNPPHEGSLAQAIAAAVPGARVVKAFNTFGAEFHADPALGGSGVDVPIATDDDDARAMIHAIAVRAGFTPVDVGPLRNAALLENLAMIWIHLAMVGGRGRNFAFKLVER